MTRYRWDGRGDFESDPIVAAMAAKTEEELEELWREANKEIGSTRAPAEDMAVLVYGYTQGRLDQMRKAARP